eukprot:g7728.t1
MGAAASIQTELAKPKDASDIPEGADAAKNEVARLRKLIRSQYVRSRPLYGVGMDASITCVEQVQAALDAISEGDKSINACCEIVQGALEHAAAADAKLLEGAPRRPLEGVPIIVKVNVDVAGTLSTASLPALADWRPSKTAPLAQRLIDAGAIVVAKTNMPEAALGVWGFSPVHGITKNPTNENYTTGGSSSGTAAGIAAGYVVAGLGSDTGGSLRIPAECCNIVGFRPSKDRYPQTGVVPCNIEHDRAGPMANTVRNLAVLDAVMADEPVSESQNAADLSKVVFGVASDLYSDACDTHKAAIDTTVAILKSKGAKVINSGDIQFKSMQATFTHKMELDFREQGLDNYLASHNECKLSTDEVLEKSFYSAVVKPFFKTPRSGSGPLTNVKSIPDTEREAAVTKFREEIASHQAAYEKFFVDKDTDVIITPCIHNPPRKCLSEEEYKDFKNAFATFGMATGPSAGSFLYNQLPSAPSLAFPTNVKYSDLDGNTMACGLLLWGKPGNDKRLIQIAMALEDASK